MMKTYEETEHKLKVPATTSVQGSCRSQPSSTGDDDPTTRIERTRIKRQDILFGGAAIVLRNFLTPEECKDFTSQGETLGLEDCGYSRRIRKTDRVSAFSTEVAQLFFDRAMPLLEDSVIDLSLKESKAHYPEGIPKTTDPYKWVASGLNPCFRICRYSPGGFFFPHHDGGFYEDEFNLSLKTFMLYLNDSGEDFTGGETRFFNQLQRHYRKPDPDHVVYSYQPQAGDALIFNSEITHDGAKLLSGQKYILRSEIMYKAEDAEKLAQEKAAEPDYDHGVEFTWP